MMEPSTNMQYLLDSREAADSVIDQLLRVQEGAPSRGTLARVFGRSPLRQESRPWYRGARGEIEVGALLGQLPAPWTVLHAVPVGKGDSDIDHILLGPSGVYSVNTKNHSGSKISASGTTLRVNGYRQDHIRNSLHEATRANKLLSAAGATGVSVKPLIVVVRPAALTVGSVKPQVTVLSSRQLLRWLEKQSTIYSDAELGIIRSLAVVPTTWHKCPPTGSGAGEQRGQFRELEREVESARRRAQLWLSALMVALVGGLVAAVGQLPVMLVTALEGMAP